MECGPDGCPIVAFSDLTAAEQRVARARTAAQMTARGFTGPQIAKQLGVSEATISRDLAANSNSCTTQELNRQRTPANPRGAGRPRGSGTRAEAPASTPRRRQITVEQEAIAEAVLDRGGSAADLAAELNQDEPRHAAQVLMRVRSRREGIEEGRRQAEIDPSLLSQSAQERLASAMRQQERRLNAEFERKVQAEVRSRLSAVLPQLKERERVAQRVMERRRSIMQQADYDLILRCLHPDSIRSVSVDKLTKAFRVWGELKPLVLDEAQAPTEMLGMPNTVDELMARRRRVQEERAAARSRRRAT